MKRLAPYLVLLAAMLWATDAPFRVHLTKDLPVGFIVLVEHFFDCLVLFPLLLRQWKEIRALDRKKWSAILAIGVGGSALATLAFTASFAYVSPSVAILLQKLQPLVAISLAGVMLKERITSRFALWAALALAGGYLISFPALDPGIAFFGEASGTVKGVVLALVATVLWGASTVLGKYVLNGVHFHAMTTLRFFTAFLFLLVWVPATGGGVELSSVSAMDWGYLAIIAVTSGVVSLFIYYRGLKDCPASVATLAELGFPIAAVIINRVFLDEKLVPMQILGMMLILVAMWRLGKKSEAPSS